MKQCTALTLLIFTFLVNTGLSGAQDSDSPFEGTVLITEGAFEMGSRRSLMELDPGAMFNPDRHMLGPEDPAHEVILDAYYVDIYEVTNEDYKKYTEATGYKASLFLDDPNFNGPRKPVVGVSWKEAQNYCGWKNMRLPTEAEWEKAARGKRPVKYPWGDEEPLPARLNYNSILKKTVDVGSYPSGKSDHGVYDMSGNVSEWVQDWHFPEYYLFSPKKNPPGPEKGHYKVIRGGNWRSNAEDVSLTYRNATVLKIRNRSIGFRCVASVKTVN